MKLIAVVAFFAVAAQMVDARISDSQLKEMLTAVNKYRAQNGVAPLILDQRLVNVAQQHSDDMAKRPKCDLDHTSRDGTSYSDRVVRALGGQISSVAENIGQGFPRVDQMMPMWINSKIHRDNLLRTSVAYVGFGYNPGCSNMWTQDFANFPKSTLDLVDSIGTFTGVGGAGDSNPPPKPSPKTSPKPSPKLSPTPAPKPSPKVSPAAERKSSSPSPRPRPTTTTASRPLSMFSRPIAASPSPSPKPTNLFGDSFLNFTGSLNLTNGTNGTFANGTNRTATPTPTQTLTHTIVEQPTAAAGLSTEELTNALADNAVSSNLLPDSQSAADGATSIGDIVFSADLLPAPIRG
ncbi:hypothetical protein BJ742DRAFT_844163 [Cladochytrium replicatum]|nr:hypothetical protein BJ742DRAFT_844163 [Cladochytrium replicatum]